MGRGFTAYGVAQMWALLRFLQATAALLLLVSNYWMLGSECVKVAMLTLSGLTVAMTLLFAVRYDCLGECVSGGELQSVYQVRRAPMLYDLTHIVLSTVFLCSVLLFLEADFAGEFAVPGWMPGTCVIICSALLLLWCAHVACRTLLALSGLCACCLPTTNGRSDNLVGDVALWINGHAVSEVGEPGFGVGAVL